MKNIPKWLIPAIVACVIVAAVGAAYLLSRPQTETVYSSISITATQTDAHGVTAGSAFAITSKYRLDEAQLREMLVLEPPMEYTLAGSGKSWTLTPAAPLANNLVYTLRVKDDAGAIAQSFAFQTRSDLLVSNVFPGSGARSVLVDTGIELTFNATDVDPSTHFSILPEIAGTFETTGYTARFIPAEPLEMNSIYRVTLRAGLAAPNGMTLQEDYTYSFDTAGAEDEKSEYDRLRLDGSYSETFLPGDPLAVALYAGSPVAGQEFHITAHRYPDINAYLRELQAYDKFYAERYGAKTEYVAATAGLEEVVTYDGALFAQDDYGSSYVAILPEDMTEGHYIITIAGKDTDGNEQFVQKLLQIQNLSVYTQSVNGEMLVWLNDPLTGAPVKDATTRLLFADEKPADPVESKSDAEGLALLPSGKSEQAYLNVLVDGKLVYVSDAELAVQKDPTLEERYYTALYTDREIYRPNDTIRFWGMVRPRSAGGAIPKQIYAELLSSYGEEDAVYKQRVTVGADGVFSGEMRVTGIKQNWYSFALTNGERPQKDEGRAGQTYRTKGLSLQEYTKPPYSINTQPNKTWYYSNEPVTVSVDANYFDGTPVAEGKMRFDSYDLGVYSDGSGTNPAGQLTLDGNGKGTITVTPPAGEPGRSWYPQSSWYNVQNEQEEDVYVSAGGVLTRLPSKIAMDAAEQTPGKLTIRTAAIDTAKIGAPSIQARDGHWPSEYERLAGGSVSVPVTVKVLKTTYNETITGTYYDYINRKTINRYQYNPVETVMDTIQTATVNGSVTIDYPYQSGKNEFFRAELSFDGGISGTVSMTYHGLSEGYIDPGIQNYSFAFADQERANFAIGEKDTLHLYMNGERATGQGTVLYTVLQKGALEVNSFAPATGAPFEMQEKYLPNIMLAGAYFDGRHVYTVSTRTVAFNDAERALQITLTPDKEEYRPGETAKVQVQILDSKGAPVAANACIGAVDEAIFAIEEQQVNLLSQLYGSIFYPQVQQNSSYREYEFGKMDMATGGKGGGGGGDGMQLRETFLDTAAFVTLQTGADGKGTVDIPLPDNVTSWRLTAAAVTDEPLPRGGDTKGKAVATLPFYLNILSSERYLAGDDLAVSAQGVGTALAASGTKIDFTAIVYNSANTEIDRLTATGEPNARTAFNFGKYDEGQYTLQIEAKCGELTDAVKKPFAVVKQGLTAPVIRNMPLSEVGGVTSLRWPVTITVYDKRMSAYMEGLQRLSGQYGDRTEIIAASYLAKQAYNDLLDPDDREPVIRDDRLNNIQQDSGVKALPSGGAETAVTAKMLVAAPQLVNTSFARSYLYEVLQTPAATPDERVMAQMGLAALEEPVLLDLGRMLQDPTLTAAQKLYLGVGLAKLGDFTGAEQVYSSLSEQLVTEGELKYINAGGTLDERIADTSAALMLTSITSNPDADALMRYLNLQEDASRRAKATVLSSLEQWTYIENFTVPAGTTGEKFSYQKDGEKQTVDLSGVGCEPIVMSYEAFQTANFSGGKNVWASVRSLDYANELETDDRKVQIEKTITTVSGEPLSVSDRAMVELRIRFADDAPYGCYLVSDLIPSGLRYMPMSYGGKGNPGYVNLWSTLENEGQTMRGYVYRTKPDEPEPRPLDGSFNSGVQANPGTEEIAPEEKEYVLIYYVSAALAGDFITESAYITPNTEGVAAKSPRGKVVITP